MRGRWDTKNNPQDYGITGLHEISGRDYGIEELCKCVLSFVSSSTSRHARSAIIPRDLWSRSRQWISCLLTAFGGFWSRSKQFTALLLNIYAIYLLTFKSPLYYLRSSGSILLSMPAVRSKTLGDRAFMVAAPTLWNSLPKELRAITNVNSFKAHIKTYLFRTLYWWAILYSVLTCIHMYSFYCYFYYFFLNALSFICFL